MRPPPSSGFWAAGGSVVAASVASVCCWLPLLLLFIGASAVGASTFLEQARPWFLGLSVVALSAGFYFNYRRDKECAAGACSTRERGLQRISRTMLWVSVLAVAALAFFPNYIGALLIADPAADAVDAHTAQIVLGVDGMTCVGCATTVEHVLKKVPGVLGASVNYDEGRAVVTLDPTEPASNLALIKAVEWAGYQAHVQTAPQ